MNKLINSSKSYITIQIYTSRLLHHNCVLHGWSALKDLQSLNVTVINTQIQNIILFVDSQSDELQTEKISSHWTSLITAVINYIKRPPGNYDTCKNTERILNDHTFNAPTWKQMKRIQIKAHVPRYNDLFIQVTVCRKKCLQPRRQSPRWEFLDKWRISEYWDHWIHFLNACRPRFPANHRLILIRLLSVVDFEDGNPAFVNVFGSTR